MNDSTTTMIMVSEKQKNGLSNLTYEQLDQWRDRSASLLYHRWVSFFYQMEENESFLIGRIRAIYSFAQQFSNDAYIRNLYFVFIGSRSQREPLKKCLAKMEKLRLHFIEENKYKKEAGEKTTADEEMILSPGDQEKIKYLMRLAVCVRLSNMIYSRLRQKLGERAEWMKADFCFDSFPLLFESQLERLLKQYEASGH